MSAHLYIEGGESKEDQIRCREAFRKLIENAGFSGRMPRLTASGSRNAAFDDFKTAFSQCKSGVFVAMLIDSEDPVQDAEKTWFHVKNRDHWEKPSGATDEQIFFMTICMETWIVCDPETLTKHYGQSFHEKSLPSLVNLENRSRGDIQENLVKATKDCKNRYAKGKRSFEVLAKIQRSSLEKLPSYQRMMRILKNRL